MSEILIAGAGHGGLVAAIHLAKKGYDVTVIEKNKREDLGHDWHDWLDMSAFDLSELSRPSEDMYFPGVNQGFRNPKATVMLRLPSEEKSICMDRKLLIKYLLDLADEAGVKFIFSAELLAPVTCGARVTGLRVRIDERELTLPCSLVIDSAGISSPIRRGLPDCCGITRELESRDVFYVYRAYFKNLTGELTDPPYLINLFNQSIPGIGWTITEKEYVDVLIGKFGSAGELTQMEVSRTMAAFRKEFPFIGEEIVRGGRFEAIPITKMLPLIVCDGYAAVGDSAGMTVPLNGSGIILSMNAGKLLADTVAASSGSYTVKELWKYEYEYFTRFAKQLILINKLKDFFTYVRAEHVDYLLEKKILTPELLEVASGKPLKLTGAQIRHILAVLPPLLPLVPSAVKTFSCLPGAELLSRSIPESYEKEAVNRWAEKYSKI